MLFSHGRPIHLIDEVNDDDIDDVDDYLHLKGENHDLSGAGESSHGETVGQASHSNSK